MEQEIDALLITGDIYDVVNPEVDAQQRFYRFLGRALETSHHLQIIIVGGNHDSAARLELPRTLLDSQRVSLMGALPRVNGQIALEGCVRLIRDSAGVAGAVCAIVPYLRPCDLLNSEGQSPVATVYAMVAEVARHVSPDLPLILTGHLHVAGGDISALSERRIIIGGEEALPTAVFPTDAVYVALGHLHKPQNIGAKIRYAGAPLPMSIAEKDYVHSVVLITINGRQTATALLPTPRPVKFLRVPASGSATLDQVITALERLSIADPGETFRPFLEVAVHLDQPEPELRRKIDNALADKPVRLTRVLRETLGNVQVVAQGDGGDSELNDLDPSEVFRLCYVQEYGTDPAEAIRNAFVQLLTAATDGQTNKAVAS